MVQEALRRMLIPHAAVIDAIREMKEVRAGGRAARVSDAAKWQAMGFVSDLGRDVPPPSVTPTTNGGVAVRWLTKSKEVEIIFLEKVGEYSVAERGKEDVLVSGHIASVNLLLDVVKPYVVDAP